MNCMIPELRFKGKNPRKVSGQITAQLKVLVGPGLWQRRTELEGKVAAK